ncbi:hypothetical protein YA36_14325 [Klebsiella aerogenes]|uniref:hypothetical protein n=1 Tax=Klebsiella aerogenes TaxID=548 RepID=UPI00063C7175|nr:hypothetical protein [Klebsiella aerogenes]KLF56399.1 hypothetical protein YA36_14325 [Klebsiella aerogenes]
MSDWVDYDFDSQIRRRPSSYLQDMKQPVDVFSAMGVMHPPIEALAKYIYDSENIYNASGYELDRFGEYANINRDGRSDDEYRVAILNAVLSASYSGTPWQVMNIAAASTRSTDVELVERSDAAFSVHITGVSIPENIDSLVDIASAAGVRAYATFDYGLGGFSLAGIDTQSGYALQIADNTAMQVDDDTALGILRGATYLGGSYLDTVYATTGISGLLQVNGEYISVKNNDYLLIGSGFNVAGTYLCGAMPRG